MIKEKIILEICDKDIVNQGLDNLLIFWNDKIKTNLSKLSDFQIIIMLIYEIDKLIEKLMKKKNIKQLDKKKEYNVTIETNINRSPSIIKRNIFEREPPPGYNFTTPCSQKNLEAHTSTSPKAIKQYDTEEKEDEKVENSYLKSRLNSSNHVYQCKFILNNIDEEEEDNNKRNIIRNNKKSATIGMSPNFGNKFIFQEELKDNNYILKTRKSKPFLNYIDIDLFFQYIAMGKHFYDNEKDNNCLIEGFCLQYQIFIFPEILIEKVIKCFNYFYELYLKKDNKIIEEKNEDDEEEKEKEKNKVEENKNDNNTNNDNNNKVEENNSENNTNKDNINKVEENNTDNNDKNLNNDDNNNKEENQNNDNFLKNINKKIKSIIIKDNIKEIPYGLIDFLYTFISLHNIYYHNELSKEVIDKIYDFLKKLSENKEIMEKCEQKIELSEIELKEYEASLKTFKPIQTISLDNKVEKNISSSDEEFNSEDEDEDKNIKKTSTYTINNINNKNKDFDINNSKSLNSDQFINLYVGDNPNKSINIVKEDKKKKEKNKKNEKEDKEKPYEFNLSKYKTQDIAIELTRISYALYSKIKIKEFLKAVFNGKEKYKLSPHICQIINRFNALSYWVIEEILAYDHSEKRAEMIVKFIRICSALKKIGNFDDCLSIITGLNNFNINKLQKTWSHIPPSEMTKYRGLRKFLSFDDNYKNMRTEISKRIEEKSFFIPYLGYFTKRLIYLEELGPYIKKNTSLINIEKIVEVYKVLKYFYELKNVKKCLYNIHDESIKKELALLQCLDPSNEDFLTDITNCLEPKFILSNKKTNLKRRTRTDINFLSNINKYNIL